MTFENTKPSLVLQLLVPPPTTASSKLLPSARVRHEKSCFGLTNGAPKGKVDTGNT